MEGKDEPLEFKRVLDNIKVRLSIISVSVFKDVSSSGCAFGIAYS